MSLNNFNLVKKHKNGFGILTRFSDLFEKTDHVMVSDNYRKRDQEPIAERFHTPLTVHRFIRATVNLFDRIA